MYGVHVLEVPVHVHVHVANEMLQYQFPLVMSTLLYSSLFTFSYAIHVR